MGSALMSSTWKPQSSIVSVTEERRNMFSRWRVAELVRRLTTASDTPGSRDSMSVIVATQEEQDMPPTERVILCGMGTVLSDERLDGLRRASSERWQREHCWTCFGRWVGGVDSLRRSKPASSRAAWMRARERAGGWRRETDW